MFVVKLYRGIVCEDYEPIRSNSLSSLSVTKAIIQGFEFKKFRISLDKRHL